MDMKRQMDLVAIAIRNGVDSDDVDAVCAQYGLDPATSDLSEIDRAVKKEYPVRPDCAPFF